MTDEQKDVLQRIINTWVGQDNGLPYSAQKDIYQHLWNCIKNIRNPDLVPNLYAEFPAFPGGSENPLINTPLSLFDNRGGFADNAVADIVLQYYNDNINLVRTMDDIEVGKKAIEEYA